MMSHKEFKFLGNARLKMAKFSIALNHWYFRCEPTGWNQCPSVMPTGHCGMCALEVLEGSP
jgi:hypothetical protein